MTQADTAGDYLAVVAEFREARRKPAKATEPGPRNWRDYLPTNTASIGRIALIVGRIVSAWWAWQVLALPARAGLPAWAGPAIAGMAILSPGMLRLRGGATVLALGVLALVALLGMAETEPTHSPVHNDLEVLPTESLRDRIGNIIPDARDLNLTGGDAEARAMKEAVRIETDVSVLCGLMGEVRIDVRPVIRHRLEALEASC